MSAHENTDVAKVDPEDQDLITRYLEALRRDEGRPTTLFRKGSKCYLAYW